MKRVFMLLLVGLLVLTALFGAVGCSPKQYRIAVSMEPQSTSATSRTMSRAIELEGAAYLVRQTLLVATVYDDAGNEITTGTVSWSTDSPDAFNWGSGWGTDRTISVMLKEYVERLQIFVRFTPEQGDPITRTLEFTTVYSGSVHAAEGFDLDTATVVAADSAEADLVLEDIVPQDADWSDCTVVMRFPFGYKTVPRSPELHVHQFFAAFSEYPDPATLLPGTCTTPDISEAWLEQIWLVKGHSGKVYKLSLVGLGYPSSKIADFNYREVPAPTP